jgi:ADP-ribose pyrophosphatase YjhB (NUDIX family)
MSRLYPERPVAAVGVVVWRDDRFLLVRRRNPPRQGEWSLPGGVQRLGETVAETARREVAEETGVTVEILGVIDVIDSIERDPPGPGDLRGRIRYQYTLVDVGARWTAGEPRAADDAMAAEWFTLGDLAILGLWKETVRVIHRSAEMHGPRVVKIAPANRQFP